MNRYTRYAVALIAAMALGAAGAWWLQGLRYDKLARAHQAAIDRQKIDAAAALAEETDKTRTAEGALREFKDAQEIKDAANAKTSADVAARLRSATAATGRLRDPNAGCGCGGGGATGTTAEGADAGTDHAAEAGGLFSAAATRLLVGLTREADAINDAYASCRADALNLRAILNPPNRP